MVESIAKEIGLNVREIALRKAFLQFTEQDITRLSEIHTYLATESFTFAAAFYDHLLEFEPLRTLLPDPETIDRLKSAQAAYFNALTAGQYDADYVKNRLRVGLVHQRVGLEPKWYIGAYRKYLSSLMPVLWRILQDDPEKFLATFDALLKIVVFDMGLALETYIQADHQALLESEERFRSTFNQVAVGIAHVSPTGRWLRVNQKLCDILGYSSEEMRRMTFQELTHPDDVTQGVEFMQQLLTGEINNFSLKKRYIHKDGQPVWTNVTISLVRSDRGEPDYFIAVTEDISLRKKAESQLDYLSNHDVLTGLPNRNLLKDRLEQEMAFAHRDKHLVAVLFVDLDRFKNINDSLGHVIGDQVIMAIATRLSSCIREGDTVARLGGDEFAMVLANMTHEEDVSIVANKVLQTVAQVVQASSHELLVTASIGISLYPRDGEDFNELLRNADTAMYRAKDSGRNMFQFYQQEMNARALDRLKLEGALRRALEREEFLLHYQPQVDLITGAMVGMEALLRWKQSGIGLVSPADFIPLAEESGLIVPIGEWVLREACNQVVAWKKAELPPLRVAVNLSARQFQQQNLVNMVSQVLEQTGCDPSGLELEITESVIMENPEQSAKTMHELTGMGIHLSIDDFGTGYSSLSYLKRFPIHSLKIDRSFVQDVTHDPDDAAIAMAVIALAHSMKLKVVAEGVENADQLSFLRQHRCDLMQGYYFSRPLPVEEVEKLMRDGAHFSPTPILALEPTSSLKPILDNVLDGIITISTRGIITSFNKAAEKMFGYQAEEIIGKNISMLMPASDAAQHDGHLERYTSTGHSKIIGVGRDLFGKRKDGSEFAMSLGVTEAWLDNAQHFIGVVSDITARKQAEETQEKYHTILRTATDGFWIVSKNGRLLEVNDAYCRMSGYSRDELSNMHVPDLEAQESAEDTRQHIDHIIAHGSDRFETRHRRKDGLIIDVEISVQFMPSGDQMLVVFVKDITTRKHNEARLRLAKEEAEESSKAKSIFLSIMSHELRTPLNAVLGFGQLLEMDADSSTPDQQQSIKYILSSGRHLLSLVNDLLDLSRIDVGKLVLNTQQVCVADVALSCVEQVKSALARQKNITIENMITDASLVVRADDLRIRQVLINLLSNAVKYNKENGRVTVSCVIEKEGRLRIQVQDAGNGISSDKLSLLFRPFERIDQEHGTIPGVGIGLHIAKQLVEAMHGTIGVESEQGQGSTFWFDLPLEEKTDEFRT
jgi:diguanylate cyclase (GGDEF)-like protein/PAS domain S-box-containing protein